MRTARGREGCLSNSAWKGRAHMDGDMAVVVVDDDQAMRELIACLLDQLTARIAVFPDCWSAWMYIKSNRADLLISDIHMNGMNGLDLLRSVKRIFPRTRCIMTSADYSLEESAIELGADAFLCKPFRTSALIELVRDLSHEYQRVRQLHRP